MHINDIEPGKARKKKTGHVVYKNATLKSNSTKIIYKLNKHNQPDLSRLEVSFSRLLELFIGPHLTPKQFLVTNDKEQVEGVAAEHYCYSAFSQEETSDFYSLIKKDSKLLIQKKEVHYPEDVDVYFLDKFKPGFFAKLMQTKNLEVDMNSLASVLCSAYTLEEDDLHKGNIGFYLIKRNDKINVVFFKIDNDLLMSDGVMSYYDSRVSNWYHGHQAFKITARDLRNFPNITDSKNHYWPTIKRFFVHRNDPKAYRNEAEINAFKELANSPEFNQAKWYSFYKHILVESLLLESYLFNETQNEKERAQMGMIIQATTERLSRLKAVLFSIPEFRLAISTIDKEKLTREIISCFDPSQKEELKEVVTSQMLKHQEIMTEEMDEKDTPLHWAIRLGDYRYHETWENFKEFANVKNKAGKTPLDLATEFALRDLGGPKDESETKQDLRNNYVCILNHLLNQGVSKTAFFNAHKEKFPLISYRFFTTYVDEAKTVTNSTQLMGIFKKLGEDFKICLKMKKEISLLCLQAFINKNGDKKGLINDLYHLKKEVKTSPQLQFIRQLRSKLWIVRKIRGLLGGTATQVELNQRIDKTLKKVQPSSSCFSCFFKNKAKNSEETTAKESDYTESQFNSYRT